MSSDKSLLYLADSSFPSEAANSVHVIHQIDALSKYFKSATLSAISNQELLSANEVCTFYGVSGNANLILNYFTNKKWLIYRKSLKDVLLVLKNKYDIIYGRSLIGMYLMSFFHRNLIFEVHTTIWDKNNRNRSFFKRLLRSKRTNRVIVISEKLKSIVLDEFGIQYEDKITVLHDAAPLNTYVKDRELGSVNVGYVGSFYKGRGIEILIELARRCKDKKFHLVGGTKDDIENEDIPKNITFYGYLPYTEASKLRTEMDVLLAPYQIGLETQGGRDTSSYMSPLKVFEYMAAKKPILISNLPVIREVLNDANSILVEAHNLNAWEDALKKLADLELAENLAKNAYNLFLKNYTWDSRAKRISQLTIE